MNSTIHHYSHLLERLRTIESEFRFSDRWSKDPTSWRVRWGDQLRQLLGAWPPGCDPQPVWEQLEDRRQYTLHRVTYFTEPGLQTFALVAIPQGAPAEQPGVLCIHGHGPLGAYPVMNYGSHEQLRGQVEELGYDYGDRLAKQGLVVFAPNLRGFGERLTPAEQHFQQVGHRDPCNVNFVMQMLVGEVPITAQLHDLKVAVDLLARMPQVRPESIGCAGLSYGGRLASFLGALDCRVKATVMSGALNSYAERIESYGPCGYQVVPGLLRYGDMAEILGLIAPRPLAIELGSDDGCCPLPSAEREFERLQQVYTSFEAPEQLQLFKFDGGHRFEGTYSIPWLVQQLKMQ